MMFLACLLPPAMNCQLLCVRWLHDSRALSWKSRLDCSFCASFMTLPTPTPKDASPSVALACRLLPESAVWTIGDGAQLVGNTAGGTAAGPGGALLVSTLGGCDWEGRPSLPRSAWQLSLRNATVQGNRAGGGGGAVAVRGPSGTDASGWPLRHVAVWAERSTFVGNSAERTVAITSDVWSSMGGALLMWVTHELPSATTNSTLGSSVPDLSFVACRLSLGQGSVVRGNTADSHGGAAALGGCSLQAEAAQLADNTAGGGGGAVAVLPSREASLLNLRLSLTQTLLQDGTLTGRSMARVQHARGSSFSGLSWAVECVLDCTRHISAVTPNQLVPRCALAGVTTVCPTAPGYTALKGTRIQL